MNKQNTSRILTCVVPCSITSLPKLQHNCLTRGFQQVRRLSLQNQNPFSKSMKFWTYLKHHIFRFYNKSIDLYVSFLGKSQCFISSEMTKRNRKIWGFLNASREQECHLILKMFHLICILLRLRNLR